MKRIFLALFLLSWTLGAASQNVALGEKTPDLKVKSWLDDRMPVPGRTFLLVFFHSTSRPAVESLAHLQELGRKFGDRVNPDAAKDPRAAAAEENLLGLLLIFPEYREEIASGRESLTGEDFTTEFNRRVFEAVMRLHGTEEGFRFELLGEEFSPEEMGRIRRMEVARQMLTQNGPTAFRTALAGLRDLRRERDLKKTGNLNDFLQMKRNKLHKGKVDAT